MIKVATANAVVLEIADHLPLFRPNIARLAISCLFLAAILTPFGGIIRPVARPLRLAPVVRHDVFGVFVTIALDSVPWLGSELQPGLHLVASQPRHPLKLPGADGLHCAVPALGAHGLQLGHARIGTKG